MSVTALQAEELFPLMPEKCRGNFLSRIDFNGEKGCWLWTGRKNHSGYGEFFGQQFSMLAHRLSYIWAKGLFDIKLTVDHLCKIRNCVNYNHFEIVTREENALRSNCPPALNKQQKLCKRGHPLSGSNLRKYDLEKRNRRSCIQCEKLRCKASSERKKINMGYPPNIDLRTVLLNSFAKVNKEKKCCPKGHLYTKDNLTEYEAKKGYRRCKICTLQRSNDYYYKVLVPRHNIKPKLASRTRKVKEALE